MTAHTDWVTTGRSDEPPASPSETAAAEPAAVEPAAVEPGAAAVHTEYGIAPPTANRPVNPSWTEVWTGTTQDEIDRPNSASDHEEKKMDMKSRLSTLWIFASLNYLYCDVASLMDPQLLPQYLRGNVNGLEFTPGFLLGAGVLVEIFIAMVLLSRVLPYRANRWTNIAAGTVMTAVQVATVLFARPAPYYAFFSAIEIATTVAIVWYAWKWTEPAVPAAPAATTSPSPTPTAAVDPSRAPATPERDGA